MTTSGVTSFNVTRDEIIHMALEDVGAFAPDFQLPTAGMMSRSSMRLNAMIKAWQAAGVGLWLNQGFTLPLVANQSSYLLGPAGTPVTARPIGIVEARLYQTLAGTDTPMTVYSREEYMSLPLKTSTGIPTVYFFDPQTVNAVLYIWPVPVDAVNTIRMTVRTPIQDFVNINETPDFPVEWIDALHFNLALRLAPLYRCPQDLYAMVKENAGITLRDANDFDREQGSVYFTVSEGSGR